jgi:hypothetical protein
MARRNCTTAINNEPKQIEPNEVVVARLRAFFVASAGEASALKYHEATAPATVTWTVFLTTTYNEIERNPYQY